MKVSVVIPVYNEEKYIKNCLDSLMNQTEKPDEIIVVDNNCTDKTVSIVKKYKRIKIIQEKKTIGFCNSFLLYDLPIINQSSLPSKLFYFCSKMILGFYSQIGPAMAIRKDTWEKVKNEVCLDDKKVHEDID